MIAIKRVAENTRGYRLEIIPDGARIWDGISRARARPTIF